MRSGVAEGGEILEEIMPGSEVFACMLGGSDGRTLFLSCAPDFDEYARSAAREAGMQVCPDRITSRGWVDLPDSNAEGER